MIGQILKFAGVGAIGTGIHYVILVVLAEAIKTNVVVASSIGAIAGGVFNYIFNYRFTFGSSANHAITSFRYATVISAGFIINGIVMALGVRYVDLNYIFIQIFATVIIFLWNFIGSKYWVF